MHLIPDSWGTALREANTCHEPAGSPNGGQFCSDGGVTASPAFRRWFKDSKVVDAHGRPLRVYHGTAKPFDTFSPGRKEGNNAYWLGDLGTWFSAPPLRTENYDEGNAEFIASDFAGKVQGARVIPAYLRITNPLVLDDEDAYSTLMQMRKVRTAQGVRTVSGASLRRILAGRGYDGVVLRNSMTDGDVDRDDWVAFYPEQIKSALGNRTFTHSKRFMEANDCHEPAGSPKGGQFCSKGGESVPDGWDDPIDLSDALYTAMSGHADPEFDHPKAVAAVGKPLPEVLELFGVDATPVTNDQGDTVYALIHKGEPKVISADGSLESAADWIASSAAQAWVTPADEDFWGSPSPLYHATDADNVEEIEAKGLEARSETRGLTNKFVGAAVFTRPDPESLSGGEYGDTIFEIDTAAMKRDGFMPGVTREEAWLEYEAAGSLMHKLFGGDIEWTGDAPWDGTSPDDFIIYGDIPAKYLKRWGRS